MSENSAIAEALRPGTSRRRTTEGSRDSRMEASAMARVTAPIGTLMKKIQPQCRCWLMNPPMSGPKASAIAPIAVQAPIAVVRSLMSSNVATMIASVVGTTRAAPRPCTSRKPISTSPLPARPAPSEASVNTDSPMVNSLRRP